jgi:hypothetical protein
MTSPTQRAETTPVRRAPPLALVAWFVAILAHFQPLIENCHCVTIATKATVTL